MHTFSRFSAVVAIAVSTAASTTIVPTLAAADGGIAVVENHAGQTVRFAVTRDKAAPRQYALEPEAKVQISTADRARLAIAGDPESRWQVLAPGGHYELTRSRTGALELEKLTERGDVLNRDVLNRGVVNRGGAKRGPSDAAGRSAARPPAADKPPTLATGGDAAATGKSKSSIAGKPDGVVRIPVKILVDEDEPARQQAWEKRLRGRIDAASDILEKQCRVRFHVVAVGTWDSDNRTKDFVQSLAEFTREVDPGPARLAIGFTSQYEITVGRTHLGGTRGPLFSHILIREWNSKITEPERLEVLMHELGHHLGAPHSAEPDSVMRSMLGDRKSRSAKFAIRFDDTSARIMTLVGEEIGARRIRQWSDVSSATRSRLRPLYALAAKSLPDDAGTKLFLESLGP